ncbi:MAG: phenylphosphate carboxylase subunit delta [Deltaproteobacteria bacterium GWF2_42_12]|nr:MAG: phenylphosphate carboxylase subunit delta [Deltaproteobacteria bacterium GWB2_42_7]OGP40939.1 MAG: phenylphosphate carboxylase subunit delta [Deltaproteobacteria bacterium GWD2_42_10]OGP47696.1 MAG: phenylphosphate carboxylase subunit delta [Deltaproteobacteria bacterium GWF2_42_12]OGQ66464.1 MAG: phenylphosphate carboxylase subunit delta [Deltaproteobacteria bacterium RIFCSPLOWO2_12_FULL_42_16]OGQ72249.1 MAG: phenylphosphate carboxylase subunit delta [Deltaproteobacteria bacterium RIFO
MTDGSIIYDDDGKEIKIFDVKDGHGIKLLMRAGIDVAIITARESQVVLHRAKNLGIDMVYQKAMDKVEAFNEILQKKQLSEKEVAYVGDELVDIPLLRKVGFAAAVKDAVEDLKMYVDFITEKNGGQGAVREICELILKTQGKWGEATEKYFM